MTNTQIPEQKTEEFPGLEQLSQKIFQIPYADLTPNLKRCIRSKAAQAAAGDILEALKALMDDLNKHAHGQPAPGHTKHIADGFAAVAKAEGR